MTDNPLEKLYNLNNEDEDFLQKLIDERIEESSNLEYKRELSDDNKEIAKDISSFANTNGGIIIYGIEEENHKPKKLCPLEAGLKEKIENIIISYLNPRLSVKIVPIDCTNPPGGQYYVIYILKSSEGPHMIVGKKDYRYYKKCNFSSIPMEDYEIRENIEKNLKNKNDSLSEIKNRKVFFFDNLEQQESTIYLRLVCVPIPILNIELDNVDFKQFNKREYLMNGLLENHNFQNIKKGKICQYGLLNSRDLETSDYMKNYLYIDEELFIEYAHLGITYNSSIGNHLNDFYVIGSDLIGYIYFVKDFFERNDILCELLFYIEINNIKDTILWNTADFRSSLSYVREHHLYTDDKWEDHKYYPSFKVFENPNDVIVYFADRIYRGYGYKSCEKLEEKENGRLSFRSS